jgi:hypothetical protein
LLPGAHEPPPVVVPPSVPPLPPFPPLLPFPHSSVHAVAAPPSAAVVEPHVTLQLVEPEQSTVHPPCGHTTAQSLLP